MPRVADLMRIAVANLVAGICVGGGTADTAVTMGGCAANLGSLRNPRGWT